MILMDDSIHLKRCKHSGAVIQEEHPWHAVTSDSVTDLIHPYLLYFYSKLDILIVLGNECDFIDLVHLYQEILYFKVN